MKCKDCIHYTAHKHFYFGEDEKDFDEYFNDDNVESQCPEFEDKKEWLKLPCKERETKVIGNIHDNPELAEGAVMTEKLKCCPFCGGKAKLMGGKVYTIPEYGENGAYVGADIEVEPSWVECQNCHSMGQTFDESDEDPEKAIEAWNRRTNDAEIH